MATLENLKKNLDFAEVICTSHDDSSESPWLSESGMLWFARGDDSNTARFTTKVKTYDYEVKKIDEDEKGFTYWNGPLFFHFRKKEADYGI